MKEAQIQLQNALTTTFLANLAFLSEYDNKLYHRLDELSRMIENGLYKEKYALEFIMEKGDFDIYDFVNEKYLYSKNPKKMNDNLIKKIQFDDKNSILDISEYFIFRNQSKIEKDKRFEIENLLEFVQYTQNSMWEYAYAINDFLDNRKKKLKKIKKFIFLGTLLGRHIPKIAEKVDAEMYLVLERNLEIFRLSLFTVDYTILAKKGAIFSIMDSPRDEEKKISDFLSINNLGNYIIKFSTTSINIDEYIDTILTVLNTLGPMGYDYNRKLYAHINRTTKVLENNYKTLLFNKIKEKANIFRNTSILYLAAGPSLDENLEWIKENQNKFFIVTIGAAFKKLLMNNIRIDMVATLDEQYLIKQFNDEIISKMDNETIVLASTITNQKILDKFDKDKLFLYEVFNNFHKDNIAFDGFSIGEVTLAILLQFNPKDIYLIGLDLALNQKTGDSHSKDSNSGLSKLNLKEEQTRNTFSDRKSLIKVKGNLKKIVSTTPLFFSSIKSAESKIMRKSKNTKIYNLSTHGAYFFNTIPKKIKNLEMDNFNELSFDNNKFFLFLKKNSTENLSVSSKKGFKKESLFLKDDMAKKLLEISENNFKTFDDFFIEIYDIPVMLHKNKSFLLHQVLVNYFQIVMPYLFYHFNDKNIKSEKKQIKKIKEIFIKQMENLFEDYSFCLERLIKKGD